MEFTKEKRKKLALWIISVFTVCSLIFLAVQNIGTVLSAAGGFLKLFTPLIMGAGFALVLDVPLNFFENHIFTKTKKPALAKLKRPLCFLISIIIILGILAGVIMLVIPELIEAIKVIVGIVTDFVTRLLNMDEAEIRELPFGEQLLGTDWKKMLQSALDWLKNSGGKIVNTAFTTIGSVVTAVVNIGVGFVFAVYILLSKDKLKYQMKRLIKAWLPEKSGSMLLYILSVANENFRNFISGQTLEAMILGGLCMVGMLILQIPYAPMVGALVGVTALIPVIGGFIGAGVGAVMILTQNPLKALIFIIFLVVLQQLEGNLIYPRVMGKRVSLPSMWILAAVTLGGSIGGPLGMLLSVPIASTCYALTKEFTRKKEEKKSKLCEKPEEEVGTEVSD